MSNATEEKKVNIEGILSGFDPATEKDTTVHITAPVNLKNFAKCMLKVETKETEEDVAKANEKATADNAEQITKLTNDAIATIRELVAQAQSVTLGGTLGAKAISLVNELSAGCHRANRENHDITTSANALLQELKEVNEDLVATKQERNLATLMVGTSTIQKVSDDPELMEGLQIG